MRAALQTRALKPRTGKATHFQAPAGEVVYYPLEGLDGNILHSDPATGAASLNYGMQGVVGGSDVALIVSIEVNPQTNEPTTVRISDIATGGVADFNLTSSLVQCPTVGSCFLDCALDKLCDLIDVCELSILAGQVAACLTPPWVGCATLLDDIAEVVICTGVDCAVMCGTSSCPPLSNAQAATGSLTVNEERCYRVSVPSGTSQLRVSMTGTGDPDLYINYGSRPTLTDWDCRPWLSGASEQCTFTNPAPGDWYVVTRGYSPTSTFTVTPYITSGGNQTCAHSPCAAGAKLTNGCSSCVSSVCACDPYCCTNSWDSLCVSEAQHICDLACGSSGGCSSSCASQCF